MAAFTAMGLGLLLGAAAGGGAAAGALAAKRKSPNVTAAPGPITASPTTPSPPTTSPALTIGSAMQAATKQRRRAIGTSGTTAVGSSASQGSLRPQVEPRTLLGY